MKSLILILGILLSTLVARAELSDKKIRLGAQAGNIGLLKEVGDSAGNAIGVGVIAGYSVVEDLVAEIGWVTSSHDDLDHDEYSFGAMYYVDGSDPIYWNLGGGIAFIDHEYTKNGENLSDVAFSLYGATGVDIFLKQNFIAGLQARYYSVFDVEKRNRAGTLDIPIIQDFFNVMFRIQYQF